MDHDRDESNRLSRLDRHLTKLPSELIGLVGAGKAGPGARSSAAGTRPLKQNGCGPNPAVGVVIIDDEPAVRRFELGVIV